MRSVRVSCVDVGGTTVRRWGCAPQILHPVCREGARRCRPAEQVDRVGADAYWYDVAPSPFMAIHDPPPSMRCRHACPPRADGSSAAGGGEPVSPEAADPLPRALPQAETAGSGDESHPRAALTSLDWRPILTVVKPDTLIRWHRQGWRLFWRWKSRPGRPPIPRDLQRLIVSMAQANPTWGEERIANELRLKLGLTVSPRKVGRYLRPCGPGAAGSGPSGGRRLCGIMRTQSSPVTSSRR